MDNGCDVTNKETTVLVKGVTKNEIVKYIFKATI